MDDTSSVTVLQVADCESMLTLASPPEKYGMDFYGYVVYCGPMCCIGFILNLLCVAVLGRDKSKVSTSFFLRMLALADNGLLAVVFFTKTLSTAGIYFRDPFISAYYNFFNKSIAFTNGMYEIVKMYAVLMVVLVTIDRCIAVYLPLQASRVCTLKTAIIEVVALAVYVIVFNMPRFFEFIYVERFDNCTNTYQPAVEFGPLMNNSVYNVVYNNLDSFVNLIFPVVLVLVLNIALVVRLTLARKSRMRMTTGSQRSNSNTSITLNLVGVVTAFVVCETPIAIITIMTAFDLYNDRSSYDSVTAHIVADMCQVLGSFINFFVYAVVGRKFRRILRDEVCCFKRASRIRMSSWSRMAANSTSKYSKDSVMTVSVTNF